MSASVAVDVLRVLAVGRNREQDEEDGGLQGIAQSMGFFSPRCRNAALIDLLCLPSRDFPVTCRPLCAIRPVEEEDEGGALAALIDCARGCSGSSQDPHDSDTGGIGWQDSLLPDPGPTDSGAVHLGGHVLTWPDHD
ncbi:hypothetical protein NDU88_006176 [Pleurodeles waltl]|uniref:Uncharacterized protein n=1 Tax=Pleurodeles waltl TaxID=8319 RepID=A0AAV7UM20_PLEWA|nr:hypothetical protein NDU88_006176 [Pleurodeles waltl]